jgi:thioesterase domain-containing protein
LCYAHLVRYLDQEQPCYGLQAPGLNGEQELYTQLEAIARHHIDVLRSVQPTGPYLLSGWSLGGVIAFEMAQQFQAEGQPVALLALIDSHAPKGDRKSQVDEAALLAGLARDLGLPLRSPSDDEGRLEQLDLDGQLAHLLEKAKRANLVHPGIDLVQVRRLFQVFKSNLQAAKRYVPRTYPGPVTLFKASEQRGEPEENLGWGALVSGRLTVHMIPGDHETIVYDPNVLVLAEELKASLHITPVTLLEG